MLEELRGCVRIATEVAGTAGRVAAGAAGEVLGRGRAGAEAAGRALEDRLPSWAQPLGDGLRAVVRADGEAVAGLVQDGMGRACGRLGRLGDEIVKVGVLLELVERWMRDLERARDDRQGRSGAAGPGSGVTSPPSAYPSRPVTERPVTERIDVQDGPEDSGAHRPEVAALSDEAAAAVAGSTPARKSAAGRHRPPPPDPAPPAPPAETAETTERERAGGPAARGGTGPAGGEGATSTAERATPPEKAAGAAARRTGAAKAVTQKAAAQRAVARRTPAPPPVTPGEPDTAPAVRKEVTRKAGAAPPRGATAGTRAKRPAVDETAAGTTAGEGTPIAEAAAEDPVAKEAPAKEAPAKKAPAKKAPARKPVAKKAAAKKTAAGRTTAARTAAGRTGSPGTPVTRAAAEETVRKVLGDTGPAAGPAGSGGDPVLPAPAEGRPGTGAETHDD